MAEYEKFDVFFMIVSSTQEMGTATFLSHFIDIINSKL